LPCPISSVYDSLNIIDVPLSNKKQTNSSPYRHPDQPIDAKVKFANSIKKKLC